MYEHFRNEFQYAAENQGLSDQEIVRVVHLLDHAGGAV
jgi:hypothetical protein